MSRRSSTATGRRRDRLLGRRSRAAAGRAASRRSRPATACAGGCRRWSAGAQAVERRGRDEVARAVVEQPGTASRRAGRRPATRSSRCRRRPGRCCRSRAAAAGAPQADSWTDDQARVPLGQASAVEPERGQRARAVAVHERRRRRRAARAAVRPGVRRSSRRDPLAQQRRRAPAAAARAGAAGRGAGRRRPVPRGTAYRPGRR